MAVPVVTASLDKTVYGTKDTMTLIVNYSDADSSTVTVTVVVTDAEGNKSTPVTVNAVIDPMTIQVTDTGNHVWTKISDTGKVATFQAPVTVS